MKELLIDDWAKVLREKTYLPIDVRSPGEYEDAHLPGAISLPLFTNEERAEVGTLYKQQGNQAAKWRAMEIVSPKLPHLLTQIREISNQGSVPLLYCWRGGSRSGSVATFAELAGLSVARLIGGYRAYRNWVLEQLNPTLIEGKTPIILHGMTGVGKTLILKKLEQEYPVLDLEGLANHRGSVFGQMGLSHSHNQKTFDSLFVHRLHELERDSYIIMEAESKRIGKAVLPAFFYEWRKQGIHILLHTGLEHRVQIIEEEYVLPYKNEVWFDAKVQEMMRSIQKRLTPEQSEEVQALLDKRDYRSFIRFMLIHYYDPRYKFHDSDYSGTFIELEYNDVDEGVTKLKEVLEGYTCKL